MESLGTVAHLIKPLPWYLVHPRKAGWLVPWDAAIATALVFTAFVTPFEVALLEGGGVDALFVINRVIDILFLLDMCLQFVLIVPEGSGPNGLAAGHNYLKASHVGHAGFITSPRQLATRYLKGWFTVDALSVAVGAVDIVQILAFPQTDLSKLRGLRFLRALRLVKLLRLVRTSRIIRRWEARLAISYKVVALVRASVGMVVFSHWLACIWALQANMVDDPCTSWLDEAGYCTPPLPGTSKYILASNSMIYVSSLYWAIATITSIGYGDIVATKGNEVEMWVACVCMVASSIFFARMVGNFASNLDPAQAEYHTTMDSLNSFMAAEAFSPDLRVRLREYFQRYRKVRVSEARRFLLTAMSPMLQGEAAWEVHKSWLPHVSLLEGSEHQFLIELALHLQVNVFAPGDVAPTGYLYIINEGMVLFHCKLLGAGKWWGEDMILTSVHLRAGHSARALTYVFTFHLDRTRLLMITSRYPHTHAQIRRHTVRMAVRREFIYQAKKIAADRQTYWCSVNDSSGVSGGKREQTLLNTSGGTSGLKGRIPKLTQRLFHASEQIAVQPLLGSIAQAEKQMGEVTLTARAVDQQGHQLIQVQDGLRQLASAVASIAADVKSMKDQSASSCGTANTFCGSSIPQMAATPNMKSSDSIVTSKRRVSPTVSSAAASRGKALHKGGAVVASRSYFC